MAMSMLCLAIRRCAAVVKVSASASKVVDSAWASSARTRVRVFSSAVVLCAAVLCAAVLVGRRA
jgi:hypothetical protein